MSELKDESNLETNISLNIEENCSDVIRKIFEKITIRKVTKVKVGIKKLSNNLIQEIMTYLHIADVPSIKKANKLFSKLLSKRDFKLLRLIGNYSYGLFKVSDFENDPSDQFEVKTIKSNKQPIFYFEWAESLDLFITSPGPYYDELTYWGYSNRIYLGQVNLDNVLPQTEALNRRLDNKVYVSSMRFMKKSKVLVVAYDKGYLIGYSYSNINNKFIQLWKTRFSEEDSMFTMCYCEVTDQLITIEKDKFKVNYIKSWNSNGLLLTKAIHIDEEFTCAGVSDLYSDDVEKPHLTVGTDFGAIYFFNALQLEDNFNHLTIQHAFKGPIAEVDYILFVGELNIFIIAYRLVGIYIWERKDSLCLVCYLKKRYIDNAHFDITTSIIYVGQNIFVTSSLDREVMVWDINYDAPIHKIMHASAIYDMKFSSENYELITSCYDKNLRIIKLDRNDIHNVKPVVEIINGHSSVIKSYQIDFINSILYTSGTDKLIKVWNYKDLKLLKTIDLGKEFCDNFILLFDKYNTIVKLDQTKNLKLIREDPKTSSYVVIKTVVEQEKIRFIINLMDGVSFAVGLENGEILIYYYTYDQNGEVNLKKKQQLQNKFIAEPSISSDKIAEIQLIENSKTRIASGALKYLTTGLKISKMLMINYNKRFNYLLSCSANGAFSLFSLKNFEKLYYNELEGQTGEITDMCALCINDSSWLISFLTSTGELWTINMLEDLQAKRLHDKSPINCIERLNNNYFIVGYTEFNRLEILNIYGDCVQSINITYRNAKPLIYLKDGNRVLVYSGSSSIGFCFDLVEFHF